MIEDLRAGVAPVDAEVARAARERIDALTKPLGSLGRVEELAVRLCAIAGGVPSHAYERRVILIGAGDHGVAADGVSAYPADVTAQMIGAFLGGFAAIGAFARVARADVYVADFGVRAPLAPHRQLLDFRQGPGTANLAREPAIPRAAVRDVLAAGAAAFDACWSSGAFDVLALGEMGIGNSTPAAALVAGLTGTAPERVAGRGTGIDDAGLARKVAAIAAGLARCRTGTWDGARDRRARGRDAARRGATDPDRARRRDRHRRRTPGRTDRAGGERLLHCGAPFGRAGPRCRARRAGTAPPARSRAASR
jgi:nicotinate-nucleotide--dimethylbenzimidazole phosphoribosyltransferase